jgi:hypothetical protein
MFRSPLLKRAFDINQVLHPLEPNTNTMADNPNIQNQLSDISPLLKGLNADTRAF